MRTCEAHRIKGWFFFPEAPDSRLPGILSWSQDRGADLELIGGFSPEPEYDRIDGTIRTTSQIVGETHPSTIYGESDSGKKISLWNTERGNYKASAIGKVQEEFWHSSWVCIGAHVPSVNAAVLRGFKVALDDLYYLTGDRRFCAPQWASIEGVDNPLEYDWGNLTAQELTRRFWEATVRGAYMTHGETYWSADNRIFWSKGGRFVGESVERIAFLAQIIADSPTHRLDPITTGLAGTSGGARGRYEGPCNRGPKPSPCPLALTPASTSSTPGP
jgi:ApeA N-terminal domain 1